MQQVAFLSKKQKNLRKKNKENEERRKEKLRQEIKQLSDFKLSINSNKVKYKKVKFDPTLDLRYVDRCGVSTSDKIDHVSSKLSIMDRMLLDKESPKVRKQIIEKSKRIGVAFNKGGLQYISDTETLKTNKRR